MLIMMENDAEMLCQVFVLSSKFFGEDNDVELKPGGKEIDVTNDNKYEYCHLVLKYRLYECIKAQIDAFLQGFHDLIPRDLIKIFDHKELELLISGLPTVDILDLSENVIYKNYSKQSNVIRWLWEILEEFKNAERAEFLSFVTGSSKVPVEGFKGLRGQNGVQKVEIIKMPCSNPDKRLPQAHTCFFQLDLPEYSSKEILKNRILLAIKEGKTFNIA
jgi:E3 ubiquitin-protein ligase HUWE1